LKPHKFSKFCLTIIFNPATVIITNAKKPLKTIYYQNHGQNGLILLFFYIIFTALTMFDNLAAFYLPKLIR